MFIFQEGWQYEDIPGALKFKTSLISTPTQKKFIYIQKIVSSFSTKENLFTLQSNDFFPFLRRWGNNYTSSQIHIFRFFAYQMNI